MATSKAVKKGEGDFPEAAKNSLSALRKAVKLEQFYRFIHENGLRKEAFSALEYVTQRTTLANKKKKRSNKKAKKR